MSTKIGEIGKRPTQINVVEFCGKGGLSIQLTVPLGQSYGWMTKEEVKNLVKILNDWLVRQTREEKSK